MIDDDELEYDIEKIETDGEFFEPDVSRYMYNKAVEHSELHNGALEAVIRQPFVKWKFNLEVVDAIIRQGPY